MYIVNFIISFSFLFIVSSKIIGKIKTQKCHDQAMTHLYQNSLKKTLDKQIPHRRHKVFGDCRFISNDNNGKHYAIGLNIKQKLLLQFKGKASND